VFGRARDSQHCAAVVNGRRAGKATFHTDNLSNENRLTRNETSLKSEKT